MPGKAIGRKLNYGFAGTVSRNPDNIIAARRLTEDSEPVVFGQAVALNTDGSVERISEDNAENFIGFAVRVVKQTTDYYTSQGFYNPNEEVDVLTRGNMTVSCNNGEPEAGGAVYLRVAENPLIPNGVIGEVEAAADGTNSVLLDNVKFTTDQIDGNGITEIAVLTRNI
jgi:hypothetical protein